MLNTLDNIDKLIEDNLGLVNKVLYEKFRQNLPYFEMCDLVQEGSIALYKAVITYNDKKKVKFSTYAYKIIYNEFLNFFERHFRKKRYCNNLVYLNAFITDNSDIECVEILASNENDEFMLNNVLYNIIINDLENSDSVDKEIITLYAKGYSGREIAEIYNINRSTMTRRINRIIKSIKKKFDI